MNDFNDCYKYLEIDYDAPFEDIQKKYKEKARELHPDLNPDVNSTEQFQKLNNCYSYIKNNFLRHKCNSGGINFENDFNIVVSFEDEEVDINKYKKDLSGLRCECPDWLERRSSFSIKDPRRLCKHLIASFEKKDLLLHVESLNAESLLKNYQNLIKIPNILFQYSEAIYGCYKAKKGFDLYWHSATYETNNVIIYYKIKSTGTSAANIYLKGHDFEISCIFKHYYDEEGRYATYNEALFWSVGLGMFIKFCNQNIVDDIKIFVSKYAIFTTAFKRLLDYYNNDYNINGRKFLNNAKELTGAFEANNYYVDNLSQLSDIYYFSKAFSILEKLSDIRCQHMSKYAELKYILKENPDYELSIKNINIILNKIGIIKKYKDLNGNNWIIDKAYENYGINFIKDTNKKNEELPSWYSVYYYNAYNLRIEKYNENEKINFTKILFDKDAFRDLYKICQQVSQSIQQAAKTTKDKNQISKKTIRNEWLQYIECPQCQSKNIHKKDKRKRKDYTVQRYQCMSCKRLFQIQIAGDNVLSNKSVNIQNNIYEAEKV